MSNNNFIAVRPFEDKNGEEMWKAFKGDMSEFARDCSYDKNPLSVTNGCEAVFGTRASALLCAADEYVMITPPVKYGIIILEKIKETPCGFCDKCNGYPTVPA